MTRNTGAIPLPAVIVSAGSVAPRLVVAERHGHERAIFAGVTAAPLWPTVRASLSECGGGGYTLMQHGGFVGVGDLARDLAAE